MSKRRPPSTVVRVGDDILARLKREVPNGGTMRDLVETAIKGYLDNRGKLTQAQFLGRVEPLLEYFEKQGKKKRRKK